METNEQDRIADLNEQIGQLEVQLAGCSVAALGWNTNPAVAGDWGWSPSYQDVLDLRMKFEAAIRLISDRAPAGQTIALYPCGCSAVGNMPNSDEMPRYCGEHGNSLKTDQCHVVRGTWVQPKPTRTALPSCPKGDASSESV